MKKVLTLLVSVFLFTLAGNLAAQEFDPNLDKAYKGPYLAVLKFNINDDLQGVFFSAKGEKWMEYEIISNDYAGEGKGWVFVVQDGMGNQYTIKRPNLGADITVTPKGGKPVTLKVQQN